MRWKRWMAMALGAGLGLAGEAVYVWPKRAVLAEETEELSTKPSGDTVLTDGEYTPDSFSWSGGTGRLSITCPKVVIKDGQAYASLVFSSGRIAYVKSGGDTYMPIDQDSSSTSFEIPIRLNTNGQIVGCTTAMSTPHEVEYTLYVGLGDEEKAKISPSAETDTEQTPQERKESDRKASDQQQDAQLSGLVSQGQTDFDYATEADIYRYEGGYRLIDVHGDQNRYLVVPKGEEVPENLPEDITVLQAPLDRIYVAATASMALFDALGALGEVGYSSLQAEGWYVENAADAMREGKIQYAGKYSEPDYEMLLGGDCDLAVESTMILHAPEVKEMLENLGIPVFVDRASYEAHPLGRTEWVKVYGALLGREKEAEAFFDGQKQVLDELRDVEDTGKTVAFFYMDTSGSVVVRRTEDYIPKMIELSGGEYVLNGVEAIDNAKQSSVEMTMEEFYQDAVNADYLVYNSTIDAPLHHLSDLYDKSNLFKEFKAVKEGHVWCTDKYLYQATDIVGQLIMDFHHMLTDEDESRMTFLKRIQ